MTIFHATVTTTPVSGPGMHLSGDSLDELTRRVLGQALAVSGDATPRTVVTAAHPEQCRAMQCRAVYVVEYGADSVRIEITEDPA